MLTIHRLDADLINFERMTEIPVKLRHWLGMGESTKSLVEGNRSWWILPSPDNPRVYFPCSRVAWPSALELVHSPFRKKVTLLLLWLMRIRRLGPHRTAPRVSQLDQWLNTFFKDKGPYFFSIYSGTPNIFVKETIQCLSRRGEVLGYLKLPRGASSSEVIENEKRTLNDLALRFPDESFFPRLIGEMDGVTLQGPPLGKDSANSGNDIEGSGNILARLRDGFHTSLLWSQSPVRVSLVDAIEQMHAADLPEWTSTAREALQLFDEQWAEDPILHILSHGDFVPWNIRSGSFAFDWEWSGMRLPWHDAFHYLWMPIILKKDVTLSELSRCWLGSEGQMIRAGMPVQSSDTLHACAYFAWQFSFYTAATLRKGETVLDNRLLGTLQSLLSASLSENRLIL